MSPSLLSWINQNVLPQVQQGQQNAQGMAPRGVGMPNGMGLNSTFTGPGSGNAGGQQGNPNIPHSLGTPQQANGGMSLNGQPAMPSGGGFMNPNTGNQAPGAMGPQMGPGSMGQPAGNPANASTLAQTGANQLQGILSGNNLSPNSNPWLAGMANAANQNLITQYQNATAPGLIAQAAANGGGAGSLGNNSSFQGAQAQNEQQLGNALGNTDANIYGQNYANAQNQITQGLSQIGGVQQGMFAPGNELLGVGALEQQQQQQDLNTQYQNALNANQYPFSQLSQFGSLLGQAVGGTGNQVTLGTQNK